MTATYRKLDSGIAAHQPSQCPCCGHTIKQDADLQWNEAARTLTGRGLATTLSPNRATIFDLLWKAQKSGRLIARMDLMNAVYADDPDGGPESDNIISVQIGHLRLEIAPFGLTIKCRMGYSLATVIKAAA